MKNSKKNKHKHKHKAGNHSQQGKNQTMQTTYKTTPAKTFSEVALSNKPTLIISKELQSQILYAHSVVGNIEWSGFVFFKEEKGTIKDLDNFTIRAVYAHILDVGTSGYTEFTIDGRIVEAFAEFPDAKKCKTGMLHSHHNMDTFFSGTDMSELHDNAQFYPYYLSLIVNHYGKYCAKIAIVGKEDQSPRTLTCNANIGNLIWTLGEKSEKDIIITMDCNIVLEQEPAFIKRLEELKAAKTTKTTSYPYKRDSYMDDYKPSWNKSESKEYKGTGMGFQKTLFGDTESMKLPVVTSIDLTRSSLTNYIVGLLSGGIIVEDHLGLLVALKRFDSSYKNQSERSFVLDKLEEILRPFANTFFKKELNDLEYSVLMTKCNEVVDLTEYRTSVVASELGDLFSLYCYDHSDFMN